MQKNRNFFFFFYLILNFIIFFYNYNYIKVFYCGDECRYLDQFFHSKYCDVAYESDDEESDNEKEANHNYFEGKCGIRNIGNTTEFGNQDR